MRLFCIFLFISAAIVGVILFTNNNEASKELEISPEQRIVFIKQCIDEICENMDDEIINGYLSAEHVLYIDIAPEISEKHLSWREGKLKQAINDLNIRHPENVLSTIEHSIWHKFHNKTWDLKSYIDQCRRNEEQNRKLGFPY